MQISTNENSPQVPFVYIQTHKAKREKVAETRGTKAIFGNGSLKLYVSLVVMKGRHLWPVPVYCVSTLAFMTAPNVSR